LVAGGVEGAVFGGHGVDFVSKTEGDHLFGFFGGDVFVGKVDEVVEGVGDVGGVGRGKLFFDGGEEFGDDGVHRSIDGSV